MTETDRCIALVLASIEGRITATQAVDAIVRLAMEVYDAAESEASSEAFARANFESLITEPLAQAAQVYAGAVAS